MSEKEEIVNNYSDLVDKIVVRYNKSFVLDYITTDSFTIINNSMKRLQEQFNSILTVFTEIQQMSFSTASNTDSINSLITEILSNRSKLQTDIHKRVDEIEDASKNAQNAASAFEVLKERTHEVEGMLSEIKDISTKTGILAINASIEAARAGKVGAGFRIIANEVRSLATQTGESTKKIEEKLTELGSSVTEINSSMTLFIRLFSKFQKSFIGVLNMFDNNSVNMDKAGASLKAITSAIKEEDVSIQEGVLSLEKIHNSLRDANAILDVVQTSHSHLDTLLQKTKK